MLYKTLKTLAIAGAINVATLAAASSALACQPRLVEWSATTVQFPVKGPGTENLVVTFARSLRGEIQTIEKITFDYAGRHYEVVDERFPVMQYGGIPISFLQLSEENAEDFSFIFDFDHVRDPIGKHTQHIEIAVFGWKRHEIRVHKTNQ